MRVRVIGFIRQGTPHVVILREEGLPVKRLIDRPRQSAVDRSIDRRRKKTIRSKLPSLDPVLGGRLRMCWTQSKCRSPRIAQENFGHPNGGNGPRAKPEATAADTLIRERANDLYRPGVSMVDQTGSRYS